MDKFKDFNKGIIISEIEYIQLKERCDSNYKAYVEADKELSKLKDCQYCWHTYNGISYATGGVCRTCSHKCNFKPILAENIISMNND